MTTVYGQSVLIQSTLNCKGDEYQVAYVPEEVIPSIGAVALQEHSLGTTDLPAVSSENGKDSISWGIVAMPPREQLLLNNVTAMFDLTCLVRVGQISNAKPYRDKLAKIVVPGLMGSTRTLDN